MANRPCWGFGTSHPSSKFIGAALFGMLGNSSDQRAGRKPLHQAISTSWVPTSELLQISRVLKSPSKHLHCDMNPSATANTEYISNEDPTCADAAGALTRADPVWKVWTLVSFKLFFHISWVYVELLLSEAWVFFVFLVTMAISHNMSADPNQLLEAAQSVVLCFETYYIILTPYRTISQFTVGRVL